MEHLVKNMKTKLVVSHVPLVWGIFSAYSRKSKSGNALKQAKKFHVTMLLVIQMCHFVTNHNWLKRS